MRKERKDQRITFVKIELKKDEYGDRVPTEVAKFSCWSDYYSQSLTARTSNIGTVYENAVYFEVDEHFKSQIDPTCKIKFNGTQYNIISIEHLVKKHSVRLIAKAVE